MVNFLFLGNADTGGQNTAIAKAINRYTKHNARSIRMNDNYIHFPYDLCRDLGHYSLFDSKFYSRDAILDIVKDAEIIVFDTFDRFYGWDINFEDYYEGKRVVYRHNGDQFRLNPMVANSFHSRNHDAIVCSTPDLLQVAPRVKKQVWLPNVVIDEDYLNIFEPTSYNEMLCVGHAPTNPARKGTMDFIKALGKVAQDIPIDLDLFSRMSWHESIRHRALTTHVYFDQIQEDIMWYGNASVEAAWLGQPVICNYLCTDFKVPFFRVNREKLEDQLRWFFKDMGETIFQEMQDSHISWAIANHGPRQVIDRHVEWIIENATEWKPNHRFLHDLILSKLGMKWVKGEGEEL